MNETSIEYAHLEGESPKQAVMDGILQVAKWMIENEAKNCNFDIRELDYSGRIETNYLTAMEAGKGGVIFSGYVQKTGHKKKGNFRFIYLIGIPAQN